MHLILPEGFIMRALSMMLPLESAVASALAYMASVRVTSSILLLCNRRLALERLRTAFFLHLCLPHRVDYGSSIPLAQAPDMHVMQLARSGCAKPSRLH